jgi:cell division septation protein DedD
MRVLPFAALAALLLLSAGCGTTDQMTQEKTGETPPPVVTAPPPVVAPVDTPLSFNTRTDTVLAAPPVTHNDPPVASRATGTQYLVQVGAFHDAANATQMQNLTRDRLNRTVLNDYNTLIGMYQIRVGPFETKEDAAAFRDRIMREYPEEYKGSWIVELVR